MTSDNQNQNNLKFRNHFNIDSSPSNKDIDDIEDNKSNNKVSISMALELEAIKNERKALEIERKALEQIHKRLENSAFSSPSRHNIGINDMSDLNTPQRSHIMSKIDAPTSHNNSEFNLSPDIFTLEKSF